MVLIYSLHTLYRFHKLGTYTPGGFYYLHHDAFADCTDDVCKLQRSEMPNRIATAIFYVSL